MSALLPTAGGLRHLAPQQRALTRVAMLMGGWSAEREVSLRSGAACAEALEQAGYQVTRIDVDRSIAERLAALKPDACFNALHGRWGEDGAVQGLLECLGLPYTHSGVLPSAVAMNKVLTKRVLQAVGMPLAREAIVERDAALASHIMEPPYVAKPIAEGSSVGVVIVRQGANRPPATIASIPTLDGRILVETFIPGRELTCAVVGGVPTDVIDIVPSGKLEFYDYEAKYAPGGSVHILPAGIPEPIRDKVRRLALLAHTTLGCRGVSRSDFRYDEAKGEIVFLEINTQPGMTGTSLVPELGVHGGLTFPELVSWIVEDASTGR